MKVDELTGPKLDYWVAKAEGLTPYRDGDVKRYWLVDLPRDPVKIIGPAPKGILPELRYSPSTNWSQGGPIVERERICAAFFSTDDDGKEGKWRAGIEDGTGYFTSLDLPFSGPTPLIAAMRCYVQSKFGEEVSE